MYHYKHNWVTCHPVMFIMVHFDGPMQERRNTFANALKLRLFCTRPSAWQLFIIGLYIMGRGLFGGKILWPRCTCITRPWSWFRKRYVHLYTYPWWRHQMEIFSALLALCGGHSQVTTRKQNILCWWCFTTTKINLRRWPSVVTLSPRKKMLRNLPFPYSCRFFPCLMP